MRRALVISGIAASLLYVATDIFGAAIYTGYSYTDHTISELSALGSPTRPIVVPLFALYPLLTLAFAFGVFLVGRERRALRVMAVLLGAYALACIPLAPMHTREILAAGGGTVTDTMHLVLTAIDSLLLIAMIVIGSVTQGRTFRLYSIITVILVIAAGSWTGTQGSAVAANQPTPWMGLAERITVYSSMAWLAVFAIALLRQPAAEAITSRVRPSPVRAFVQRHATVTYFALTFAISWGGIIAVVGPGNILASKQLFESYVWVPPLVLGPCVAGILTTWLVGGRAGLREYRSRLLRWRVGVRWYAIALLTAPVYYLVTSFVLSLWSPEYLPNIAVSDDRGTLLLNGTIIALSAGLFEELGWTGFATPAVRRRHGPTATGLIVGVWWGIWHALPETLGANAFGFVPYLALQLTVVVVGLTAFRILMVWVYERTQSTLIGILMHAGLTTSLMLLQPLVVGRSMMFVGTVLDVVPWLIVATVALVARSRTLSWPGSPTPRPA